MLLQGAWLKKKERAACSCAFRWVGRACLRGRRRYENCQGGSHARNAGDKQEVRHSIPGEENVHASGQAGRERHRCRWIKLSCRQLSSACTTKCTCATKSKLTPAQTSYILAMLLFDA